MEIIYILWLRQIKRYFRSKPRILSAIGQPLLYLVAFGYGFGSIYAKAEGGSYIEFLAPGIMAMSIMTTALMSGLGIIWDKQFGFLKETLVAPVSRFEIMLGRTLGGATTALFQGLVIFVIAWFIGFRPELSSWPLGIIFMALMALIFTAIGTAIASKLDDMESFPLIMNFLIMPLFFLSGALFPIGEGAIAAVAKFDPLSYGVDGLRFAFTGIAQFNIWTDFLVLGGLTAIFLALGSYLFSRIEI